MRNGKHRTVHVRFDDKEFSKLKTHAEKCGLTQSEYIRRLVRGTVPRETPTVEYTDVREALLKNAETLAELGNIARASGLVETDAILGLVKEQYRLLDVLDGEAYGGDQLNERNTIHGPD